MATSAFVAALMSVCAPAVSATQFALLTSESTVGQRVFGFLAASVVAAVDWTGFFVVTIAMAIPGIVLAWLAMGDRSVAAAGAAARGGGVERDTRALAVGPDEQDAVGRER
jgi:hypothetical protein